MLFVWQGASICAYSHAGARRGNLNCHMASALGNTALLLYGTTFITCTFSHQLEERVDKRWDVGKDYMHAFLCAVFVIAFFTYCLDQMEQYESDLLGVSWKPSGKSCNTELSSVKDVQKSPC